MPFRQSEGSVTKDSDVKLMANQVQ